MNESQVFADALKHATPAERAAYLEEACTGDLRLRADVEALLQAHADHPDFLEQPAVAVALGDTLDENPAGGSPNQQRPDADGTKQAGLVLAGRYKLLEEIGEGGMGSVWMARQQEPVKRLVAVKLIKPGMDSKQVLARFEAERQALAIMDHPNIAKVHDGGATAAGRPFFVMELVRGVPITDFCDQNHLTPRQRLELFVPVCQAVQHAHQKGIIHRDLKPSNILVAVHDTVPVVKVIDFGVAKALGQELTDRTLYTGFSQMIGTPLYMSPEQAGQSGLDIDTRSDIYSLGVLLYELLTGTTPFGKERFKQAGYDEIRRIIRDEEPPRPSTRLSESKESLPSISAQRHMEPAKLTRLVRGELDWIVMKALEKDRGRRYETANGFAMDVQRYLNDEAVQACPPSAWYRFRKFARRNKRGLATMTALALAVLVTMVALAVSNVLIQREAAQKEEALNDKTEALGAAQTSERNAKIQEDLAKKNADQAETERRTAVAQEKIAKQEELTARRRFYAAQTNLAMQAWEADDPGRVLELLESQRPRFDDEDLRTFEWYYLWRLCHHRHLFTVRGDRGECRVAFSPDGKTLASGSGFSVNLWDVASRRELATLRGHTGLVRSVAFSPDGKTVASTGNEGVVRLWNVATGRERTSLPGHTSNVLAVAFSADGKWLASGSNDNTAKLWDLATGQERFAMKAHGSAVWAVAFSPDGKILATGSGDSTIKLWDAGTGAERSTLKGHKAGVLSVAFSPDGKILASGSFDRTVKLWDLGTEHERTTLQRSLGVISSVDFSPDGKTVAIGNYDRSVKIWDIVTGRVEGQPHGAPVTSVAFSSDSKSLASASVDGIVRLWDVAKGPDLSTLQGHTNAVGGLAFSPDNKTLASGGQDGAVKLWDVTTGQERFPLKGHNGKVDSVAFSPDGTTLASGGWTQDQSGAVKLWDVATGQERRILEGQGSINCVAFSPDGKTLAGGSQAGTAKLWDVATGSELFTLETRQGAVGSLAFSPDGQTLAVSTQWGTVKLWDLATRRQKANLLSGYDSWIWSVAFSPDGKTLAAGRDDGTVTLWGPATEQVRARLKGHTTTIFSLAFSPDSKTLASGSLDGTVKLWDVPTGQERMTIKAPPDGVHAVAFSPNGQLLATASGDSTVKLCRAPVDPEALATRTELDTDDPESPIAQREMGNRLRAAKRLGEADEAYCKASARLQKLADQFPGRPEYQLELARTCKEHSLLLVALGETVESQAAFARALALFEHLSDEFPAVAWRQRERAELFQETADLLRDDGRPEAAEKLYRLALKQATNLATESPTSPETLEFLRKSYEKLGVLFQKTQRNQAGEELWLQAISSFEKLAVKFPGVPEYRYLLAWSHCWLGSPLALQGRRADAEECNHRAVEILERLVAEFPADVKYRSFLVMNHQLLAQHHTRTNRLDLAAKAYARAIELTPENAKFWSNLGGCHAELGQWKEAAAAFSRAIELHSDDLEGVWVPLALLRLKAGQTDDYRRLVSAALDRFGKTEEIRVATNLAILAKLAPGPVDELAAILEILDRTLARKPDDALAVAIRTHLLIRAGGAAKGVPLLEALMAAVPDGRGDQRFNLLFLAMGRKQLGRDAEALEAFRAAERWRDKQFNAWFNQIDFDRTRDELASMLGVNELPPK